MKKKIAIITAFLCALFIAGCSDLYNELEAKKQNENNDDTPVAVEAVLSDGSYSFAGTTYTLSDGVVTVENEESGTTKEVGTVQDDGSISITYEEKGITITIKLVGDKVEITLTKTETDENGEEITKTYKGNLEDGSGTLINTEDENDTVTASKVDSADYDDSKTTYTVTVAEAVNGTVTANPTSATAGTKITLSVTPSDGYAFGSYSVTDADGNAITVTDGTFTMPESNVTVSATFEELPPDSYSISVSGAENGTVSVNKTSATEGETVTLTITPETGYKLSSLTVIDSSGNAVTVTDDTFTMPAGNVTVTATFTVLPLETANYTVKHLQQNVADDEYTLKESETKTGTVGATTEASAKNYDGFTAQTVTQKNIVADGSTEIEIKYDRNTYTVTFNTNGGTEVEAQTMRYEAIATTPVAPTKGIYTFTGWYTSTDGGSTLSDTAFDFGTAITANTTLYAKWAVDLSTLTDDYEAQDGDVLISTLSEAHKISIADGATVTLESATIDVENEESTEDEEDRHEWAGITCAGDATIILKGENIVKGVDGNYPGIFIAVDKTLTIKGDGSLTAISAYHTEYENYYGAGIGGGWMIDCGNIVIAGGTITAKGGWAAGIGGGHSASCGDITITGGTVTATSDSYEEAAAGIGSGDQAGASCGNISITGGTVTATGGENGAGIGSGSYGAECGDITITGGTVTANGGAHAVGIGSGVEASCGDITITSGVTKVTATGKNINTDNDIGIGNSSERSTCGKITIGGTEYYDGESYQNDGEEYLATSPLVYPSE